MLVYRQGYRRQTAVSIIKPVMCAPSERKKNMTIIKHDYTRGDTEQTQNLKFWVLPKKITCKPSHPPPPSLESGIIDVLGLKYVQCSQTFAKLFSDFIFFVILNYHFTFQDRNCSIEDHFSFLKQFLGEKFFYKMQATILVSMYMFNIGCFCVSEPVSCMDILEKNHAYPQL